MSVVARAKYDPIAIAFHWLMAALILAVFAIGLTLEDLPKDLKPGRVNLHNALGLIALLLLAARIAWRATHKPPVLPAESSAFTRRWSHVGHMALYGFMALVPIIGAITIFARGRSVDFGLFVLASPLERNRPLAGSAENIHSFLAYALAALVIGHILMAFYHQFYGRESVLPRMIPGA